MRVAFLAWLMFVLLGGAGQSFAMGFEVERYSNISKIENEGEIYGLEILIIPYVGGKKVLWRPAPGRMGEPVLVEMAEAEVGSTYVFAIPAQYEWSGDWKVVVSPGSVKLLGPNGRLIKLKKVR